MLNYKKLDVYRCSIEHLALVAKVLDAQKGRRGNADLMDQLRRAALSVPLNIAEGVGRSTPADQARHLRPRRHAGPPTNSDRSSRWWGVSDPRVGVVIYLDQAEFVQVDV